MSDNIHLRPSASPPIARPKPSRSTTIGVVRGRTSPTPGVGDQSADGRPPTKRARKAINCTSAMCYQDARGHEGSDPHTRGDDQQLVTCPLIVFSPQLSLALLTAASSLTRIDPAQEIARLRHSISLLEAYVFPNQRPAVSQRRPSDAQALVVPKKEVFESDVTEKSSSAVGMLGSQVQGGLYAGATSAATHLIMTEGRDSDESDSHSRQHSQDRASDDFASVTQDYDRDLLSMLPSLEIIDGLLEYYFEYCNWIYRHVNQASFTHQWEKYKTGVKADRVVLSTACALMAIATHYLPSQHSLLDKFNETHEEIGIKFFEVSTTSLQKHTAESRAYTIELVELLLVRTHFHTLAKTDSEEIWHVRGELVTIGTAMGLHRDPGKWRMHRDVAERRRWAWWHIILLERWQAFLFGRPLCIASHHFDTQLPSYCDPSLDKTGRLYLPNIALFRLAFILGDIMDDAVSIRPVSYESVQANDRALTQWMETLPPELDMDEFRVARSLASPSVAVRRLGVQSVIIRTSYYHIRFTLHRPYASAGANPLSSSSKTPAVAVDPAKSAQSLEIAVSAADKLITMVGQSRPDFLANSSLAVPGHMNWQPFHCFSAAMFFSFQLIANPDQPGAGLFRASIRKAITTLEQARGIVVADKALDILNVLCPLYSPDFPLESAESREKKRAHVLGTVRKLAFPYHDSHDPRRFGDSPGTRGAMSSPANSSSVSPPMPVIPALPQHSYDQPHNSVPSIRNAAATLYQNHSQQSHSLSQAHPGQSMHSPQNQPQIVSPHAQNLTPTPTYQTYNNNMSHQPQTMYDPNRYPYVQVEDAMWGAAVGFGHAEWSQFLDSTRTEGQSSRHLQSS